MLFDVSFALGAFFAGMILSESELQPARRAGDAAAARRLRGAVLRLGRHAVRSDDRAARAAAGAGDACSSSSSASRSRPSRSCALFGHPNVDRADDLGEPRADRRILVHPRRPRRQSLALLPERGRDLILAGAILSILLNPLLFALARPLAREARRRPRRDGRAPPAAAEPAREPLPVTQLAGPRRAGRLRPGRQLRRRRADARPGPPFLVIEDDAHDRRAAARARASRRSPAMPPIRSVLAAANLAGGALPAGRDSRCVRGRAGGRAGARAQCRRCRSSRARIPRRRSST